MHATKPVFLKFLLTSGILSLILLLFSWIATNYSLLNWSIPFKFTCSVVLFFFMITSISNFMILITIKNNFHKIIMAYMTSIIIKLGIYGLGLFVFVSRYNLQKKIIVVTFMVCYVLYTLLEKYFLINSLKKQNNSSASQRI